MSFEKSVIKTNEYIPENAQAFRALILDDSEVDRMRLRKLCANAGMDLDIHEAVTIKDMRAHLDRMSYDLVFLDHHLEMETGLEALKVLAAHPDQSDALPIMVTSVTDHNIAVEAMREGCADYLVKEELSVEALRKSITSAIERRILLAALSEARAFQANVHKTIHRFVHSCGPEMRSIMSGMLRQIRTIKMRNDRDVHLGTSLTALETGCKDLFTFLDDLTTVVASVEKPVVRSGSGSA